MTQTANSVIGDDPTMSAPPPAAARGYAAAGWIWLILAVAAGVAVRLVHYLGGRSLWVDELRLALNLQDRPFSQLLKPLDYDQMAPPGFLAAVKLALLELGNTERALHLVPLIAGILALLLFAVLARRALAPLAAAVAVWLFALAEPLVYYASELKQYGTDVAVATLLLLLAWSRLKANRPLQRDWLFLAGALVPWFSHPSVFILASIGISDGFANLVRRQWRQLFTGIAVCLVWLASFALSLWLNGTLTSPVTQNMQEVYWGANFLPLHPHGFGDVMWLPKSLFEFFVDPGGFKQQGVAALAAVLGLIVAFRRDWRLGIVLIGPLLVALAVSGARMYPFTGRFLLFYVPSLMLLIGIGVELVAQSVDRRGRIVAVALIAFLLFSPVGDVAKELAAKPPFARMEIKQVLGYVQAKAQPDDTLYIFFAADEAFKFYGAAYGLQSHDTIMGHSPRVTVNDKTGNWDKYLGDVDALKGKGRVWIIFDAQDSGRDLAGMDQDRFFLYFADRIGKQLDHVSALKASAYLYDFPAAADAPAADTATPAAP